MGYAQTSIIFYGVELPNQIAQQIFTDAKYNHDDAFTIPGPRYYRALDFNSDRVKRLGLKQPVPVSQYKEHESAVSEYEIIYPTLISDGTDSRIHSLICDTEDGYTSYLGVFIASKGYGFEDKISAFAKNLPPEADSVFQAAIAPILTQYGINESPELHIIQQVW